MKKLFFIGMLFMACAIYAQQQDEVGVRRTMDLFYDGFNERDSVKIKLALAKDITYQKVEEVFGSQVLKDADLSEVMKSIVAIPKTTKFELKMDKIVISANDGHIANVWTQSQFYLYGTYYQCGSSSFQLIKRNGDWKIISILDDYSKENCLGQK